MRIRLDPLELKMQLFKFSNACLQNFNKGVMFMLAPRNRKQIFGAIVMSNTIDVMYYPAFGKALTMRLSPYYNMLQHIAKTICPGMLWHLYSNIPTRFQPSALPLKVFFTFWFIFKPIFGTFFASQKDCLLIRSMRKPTFFKYLMDTSVLFRVFITKKFPYFRHRHFLFPMHIEKNIGWYISASYNSFIHNSSISQRLSMVNVKEN